VREIVTYVEMTARAQLSPAAPVPGLILEALDHPRALPNYHRRGFRTFKTEQGERG
jgi:hypothetical protein